MMSEVQDLLNGLANKEEVLKWNELLLKWALEHGIKIVLIVVGAYILDRVGKKFIDKAVRIGVVGDNYSSRDAELKREETLIRIFVGTLNVVMVLMVSLMVLQELGVQVAPLLAGAGIVGLAVGFGGQYLIRDIITGMFIIIENQYRIGDVVSIGTVSGTVEDITLRKTVLRDMDGTVHHVPHGEIKLVSNMSKTFSKVNISLGVAYNCDIDHVKAVINKTGEEMALAPEFKKVIKVAPQFLRVDAFGESAIMIKITGETAPSKQWEVSGEFRKRLKKPLTKRVLNCLSVRWWCIRPRRKNSFSIGNLSINYVFAIRVSAIHPPNQR